MKPLNGIVSYFQSVAAELRKVTWPTLPTMGRYFLSVVLGLALATGFIWVVDYAFVHLLSLIVNK